MKVLDKNIDSILGEAGLNQSETNLYLKGLDLGLASSRQFIQSTKMPRPTVMAGLKTLRDMGLCRTYRQDGRSFAYKMLSPANLKPALGKQIRQLDDLIQKLDNLPASVNEVEIQSSSGQENLENQLEMALRCKSRQWQVIAPRDNALAHMPPEYVKYFKKVRSERQIRSQTLWDEKWKNQSVTLHDLITRKPRYVSNKIAKNIPSMLIAFDDKLLAIQGTTNPSIALVQSSAIVGTFKIVFEIAWQSSK